MRPLAAGAYRIKGEGAIETLGRALELEARGADIVHLEVGEPDFATPAHIVEAGIAAIRAGRTRYGPAPGDPGLRAAIAEHLSAARGLKADPACVLIAPGAKPIIFLTLLALVEAGDEVIVPDPGFPAYEATVLFAGGVPVSLPLRSETGFRVDVDELRGLITPRTKLLILNSPANPTGGALSESELEAIAELAQRHDLWVLSDEIYAQLYYTDQPPASIAALPGMAERTVVLDGFSKSYAMTGWRLGYGVYPEPLVDPVTKIIINGHTCVAQFVQAAGLAALRGPQDCVAEMRAEYRARRDLVVGELNAMPGLACTAPAGAFYALPRIKGLAVSNARAFTNHLLEHGVAALPGTDFGAQGESHFRISYATSREKLMEGLRRIGAAAEALQA